MVEKLSRSKLKRIAIIDAAKYAFKAFGVKGTSMDKLAEIAKVSKRTVYNHFATKEALVMHLVTSLWQQTMVKQEGVYQAQEPLEAQLIRLIGDEISLMSSQEYIDLSRVAFGHLFYHPEALKVEIEKMALQETALKAWLKSAVKDKKLAIKDVDLANKQIHNLVKGTCFWPQLMGVEGVLDTKAQKKLASETVEMFLSRYQKK